MSTAISLIALVLVAASCGTSDGATAASSGATNEDAAATATSVSSDSNEERSIESPIADLLGIPLVGDESEQYFTDLTRRAEVMVAECMLAQGFEYQVVDLSAVAEMGTVIDTESRAFTEQYGFGIASNPFGTFTEAIDAFEDPNAKYYESLSEGEQAAYDIAMQGDFSEDEADAFELSGCLGTAYNQVYKVFAVFEEFGSQLEDLEKAVKADARIVAASQGWSSCMSEAGFRYADVEGAQSDLRRRYDAIVGDAGAAEGSEDVDVSGDSNVIVFGVEELPPEVQAQVDELAVEEREVAVASWDCNGPLREIEDQVRVEYEQRWVDENGAAVRASLNN